MSASTPFRVRWERMLSAQCVVHVLDSRSRMCCVLRFDVFHQEDATATDESAVKASSPWVRCCKCKGTLRDVYRFSAAAC